MKELDNCNDIMTVMLPNKTLISYGYLAFLTSNNCSELEMPLADIWKRTFCGQISDSNVNKTTPQSNVALILKCISLYPSHKRSSIFTQMFRGVFICVTIDGILHLMMFVGCSSYYVHIQFTVGQALVPIQIYWKFAVLKCVEEV